MTGVNVPLLRKAVEWAEAEATKPPHLSEWVQSQWRVTGETRRGWYRNDGWTDDELTQCGTAYCIAGYVCHINGLRWSHPGGGALADGRLTDDVAMQLLGITESDAEELFEGSNSIGQVRAIAEDIAGEKL